MRLLVYTLLFFSYCVYGEERAFESNLYIAKGACPFECCSYSKWYAQNDVRLLKEPDLKSTQVALIKKGRKVNALTGEIHIYPSKFVFTKAHWDGYEAGNVIWILHNLGEGEFKAWNGHKEVGVVFLEPGDGNDLHCDFEWHPINCSGDLIQPLNSEWWIKIELPTGVIGWTNEPIEFGNKDACG